MLFRREIARLEYLGFVYVFFWGGRSFWHARQKYLAQRSHFTLFEGPGDIDRHPNISWRIFFVEDIGFTFSGDHPYILKLMS